jgi:hypothetical protein
MRSTILLTGLLLAACGGAPTTTVTTGDGTTIKTGADGSAEVVVGNAATASCADKPDYVPLYADAKLLTCVSGKVEATGRTSGTLVYTSAAAPAAVLAWSKEQATKAGLSQRLSTETMFSAGEGNKRTLAVMAAGVESGSQITVNWGVGS